MAVPPGHVPSASPKGLQFCLAVQSPGLAQQRFELCASEGVFNMMTGQVPKRFSGDSEVLNLAPTDILGVIFRFGACVMQELADSGAFPSCIYLHCSQCWRPAVPHPNGET